MTIIKHILARSPAELEKISWRTHDAEFDPSQIVFDADRHIVSLSSVQEPCDIEDGLPASAPVRSTWRFEEYAVPFLRCSLTIHEASALRVPDEVQDEASGLLSVDLAEADGVVRVWTDLGKIDLDVTQLHVELAISDDLADVRLRRVGRSRRWDSTTHWPPGRQRRMKALVLQREGPPPPLPWCRRLCAGLAE
jgi:hypothetical protein